MRPVLTSNTVTGQRILDIRMISRCEDGPEGVLRGYKVQGDMFMVVEITVMALALRTRGETDTQTSHIKAKSVYKKHIYTQGFTAKKHIIYLTNLFRLC